MDNIITNHAYLSIVAAGNLIREKKLSPELLVKECIERIKKFNPRLNAFITITEDEAMENARIATHEINNGNYKGPLHGIPVAVKDFYDTAGIRTTAGFEHFKNRIPQKDAEVVARLKEAGAIIVGKTNMDKLGMGTTGLTSYFGAVNNPWNENYIAGGSSGGSAAAVAMGLCFATVDTDAIGSCRLPAACCGVTGLKVSPGLISQQGILEGEKADDVILALSQTGITTRTAEDVAIMLSAIADKSASPAKDDHRNTSHTGNKVRIGVVKNFKATDAIRQAFSTAIATISSLGYTTVEIEIPFNAASFSIKTIEADRKKINEALFAHIDILLLPTTTGETLTIDKAEQMGPQALAADNTMLFNYLGLPAISVPCGFDGNGLPIGLQIAGGKWRESEVLEVASAYQAATTWQYRHPGNE